MRIPYTRLHTHKIFRPRGTHPLRIRYLAAEGMVQGVYCNTGLGLHPRDYESKYYPDGYRGSFNPLRGSYSLIRPSAPYFYAWIVRNTIPNKGKFPSQIRYLLKTGNSLFTYNLPTRPEILGIHCLLEPPV